METLQGRKVIYSKKLRQLVWSNTNEPIQSSWSLGEQNYQFNLFNVPNLKIGWEINHCKYAEVLNSFLNGKGTFDYTYNDNSSITKHPALTEAVNAIEYKQEV